MLLSRRLAEISISVCEFRDSGTSCTYLPATGVECWAMEARYEVLCFGFVKNPNDVWLIVTEKRQESSVRIGYRKYK